MSDEPQPELRWAPLPPKPSSRGRVWLIAGLVLAALLIAAVLLFFLIPRGEGPIVTPSPSASSTPPPSPTPTPTPTPTPVQTPVVTPPPVADPELDTFAAQVQPRLDDATTGLGLLEGMNGQEAVQVVDQLQQDADRLAEAVAPSSISSAWYAKVSDYASRLSELRAAYEAGTGMQGATEASETALASLRELVGL